MVVRGNMFFVCGRDSEKGLRVLDTSDNTVEYITVEQLKLLQILGYQLEFNTSMDYIYCLYSSSLDCNIALSLLAKALNKSYRSFDCYPLISDMLYNTVFYLLPCVEQIFLVSISCNDNSYKMHIVSDVKEKMGEGIVETVSFSHRSKSRIGISYGIRDKVRNILIYDNECNYITSTIEGY